LGYGQLPYLAKLGGFPNGGVGRVRVFRMAWPIFLVEQHVSLVKGRISLMENVSFLQLMILSLASFRLTRLLVFDKITEFIRHPFFDEVEEENAAGEREIYYIPKPSGPKRFFGELLSCYWCTGIWTAVIVVGSSFLFPGYSWPIFVILAVAGMASILETILQYFMEN
jgi:hypothetical protein